MRVPEDPALPQVFVSKASEDADAVARVVPLIERAGMRAWISERDIPAGADHGSAVPAAIGASGVVLLLLSRHAIASPWVMREVEWAVAQGVPVVPVALASFPGVEALSEPFRFRLTSVQIQLDGDLEAAIATCRHLVAPDVTPAPPVPASPAHSVPHGPPSRQGEPQRVATANPRAFVGGERQAILDALRERWAQVVANRQPQVVVLLGETGFGKTRIVQELYRTLAAAQETPPFWPADLTSGAATGQQALRESRKRVAPQRLAPPAGSHPTYLWLGHVVDEGHGSRLDRGLEGLADDLARALAAAAIREADGVAAAMLRAGVGQPASGIDSEVAVTELLRRGSLADQLDGVPGSPAAFWRGVRALWSDPAAQLPAVVCIEDGHLAGQGTVTVLEQLATSSDLPFLVLVCGQESRLGGGTSADGQHVEDSLVDEAGSRLPLGRLIDEELPGMSVVRLTRLPDSAVRSLVLESLPDLDDESVGAALVKVDGNPYHAHTLLAEMTRAAEQGRLDAEWVRLRPGSFEEELRLQWRDLPDDVRRLLSGIAVLGTQVPERIGRHAVGQAVGADPQDAVAASLRTGWLRRLASDEALRFLERPRWVIANDKSHEEWSPTARRRIIEEALGTLEALAVDSAGGLGDPLLQELHLALARVADAEGIPFDRVSAVRSGLASSLRLRLASDDAGCLGAAQDTESLVSAHDRDPGMGALAVESALSLRIAWTNALSQGGTASPTVAAAELAVQRALRVAARRPDLCARAYGSLARSNRVLFDDARLRTAVDALAEAQRWLAKAPAADAQTRAEVLHARAMMAKARGDNRLGAELTEQRLALLERSLGPLDRRTVIAILNAAFYWNRVDLERSVALKVELLERRMRVWGDPSRTPVAVAEKLLAFALVRLPGQDRLDEALERATRAMSVIGAARGMRHSSTVMARGVWCFVVCRVSDARETAGDASGAEELRRAALAAAEQNLANTPSDARPQTVMVRRRRVAECLVRFGDPAGITMLREILERELKGGAGAGDDGEVGSPADIEVLWTVAELVAGLRRLGRVAESDALAAEHPIARDERWPDIQPRGWRSTRPEDARAGVL